jgi:hypothetical protein
MRGRASCKLMGCGVARPNKALQRMRGLACFERNESLTRRPRTPDPCVVSRCEVVVGQ